MSQDFYSRPVPVKELKIETPSPVADEEIGCCQRFRNRTKTIKDEKLGQWL
jgi:hypothetical protein